MIHNFINKNKYFNENLKNVLHIVFSNYDSNTTTINGLNTHIKTAVNTIYKDKDVNDLYEVLQNMKNTTVTDEDFEDIDDIDNTPISNNLNQNKDITENLSKNAKKTLEDKVSSLKKEETDDTTIIPFSTVPVTANTSEMKTALTDKAKEILETKIKEALNKPAITVTAQPDVDTTVMKTSLTDKAKETFNTDVLSKITNDSSGKENPTKALVLCQRKSYTKDNNVKKISDKINEYVTKLFGNGVKIEYLTYEKDVDSQDEYDADYKFIFDSNGKNEKYSDESKKFIEENKESYSLIILNTCPLIFMNYKDIYDLLKPGGYMAFKRYNYPLLNDNDFDISKRKELFNILSYGKNPKIDFINKHFDEYFDKGYGSFVYKKKDKEAVKMDVAPVNDMVVTEEMNYLSNTAKYMEEIENCIKFPRKRFGIENPGAQCYSNALFQMLYSMPTMRKIFSTITINDTNDSIGLLVNRFKEISNKPIKQNFTIGQNEGDTCLAKYFIPSHKHLNYTNQNDTAELFTQIIVTSVQLRIYKYIFSRYNNDISVVNNFNDIPNDMKNNVIKAISYKLKQLTKTEKYNESFDILEQLYEKYVNGEIIEDEEKILFNSNDTNLNININQHSNIIGLFDFIKSFTLKYKKQILCSNNQHVVSKIDTLFSTELSIINETNNNFINNIQDAINYTEIEEIFTLDNQPYKEECKNIGANGNAIGILHKNEIPIDNKYLIFTLKRWDPIYFNKIPHEVEPNKTIRIDNIRYTLTGVICHTGDTRNSGHYIYIQCNENGDYYYIFDDTNVYHIGTGIKNKKSGQTDTEFININGYVLLYSRYPVDQYNPENTQHELIAKNKELDTYEKIKNEINTNLINIAKKDFEDTTSIYYIKKNIDIFKENQENIQRNYNNLAILNKKLHKIPKHEITTGFRAFDKDTLKDTLKYGNQTKQINNSIQNINEQTNDIEKKNYDIVQLVSKMKKDNDPKYMKKYNEIITKK